MVTPPWWISGLVLMLVGCRAPPAGTSAFEVVPSGPSPLPAPRQVEAEPTTEVYINSIPVRPRRELAKPEYPAEARAARAGDHVVYVTITVDEDGQVADVHPTPAWSILPGPYGDAFLAAVRAAIATWELEPARQVYWQRVPGQEDQYLRTETIAERLELKFSFTLEDPSRR